MSAVHSSRVSRPMCSCGRKFPLSSRRMLIDPHVCARRSRKTIGAPSRATWPSTSLEPRSSSVDPWPHMRAQRYSSTTEDTKRLPVALLYLRSEEHTSELQSRGHLVCRLLLEK